MTQADGKFEEHVVIVGLGLIGGSIAAAVRKRFPDCKITAVGRSADRLQQAKDRDLVTDFATELSTKLLAGPAVVVCCLPVNMIADSVREMSTLCSKDVVLTDAGSVKASICSRIEEDPKAAARFVGAHPIAGGENGGFEFSDADLFVNRKCVITPSRDVQNNQRVKDFWSCIGCEISEMTPEDHDRVLALTSHLPHIAAAATASTVGKENLSLCGSGFRDATRIAAGNAQLWKAILSENRAAVLDAVDGMQSLLAQYRQALESGDDDTLQQLLAEAANIRTALDD